MQAARAEGADVKISTNLPEMLVSRMSIQQVGSLAAMSLRSVPLHGARAVIKRSFDLVVASTGLVVMSPVFLVVGAAIRLTSRGPILFRQDRVTKGGRTFTMYKFRSMVHDPEPVTEEGEQDVTRPFFKKNEDPRLTRVGRFVRRWSLDEIPQLFNVLRGDMSLVGPRPLPAEQVAANLKLLESRHEMSAGISGWWQVNGRSDIGVEEAVRLDLFYIDNWSLLLDLHILIKTLGAVVTRRGAY